MAFAENKFSVLLILSFTLKQFFCSLKNKKQKCKIGDWWRLVLAFILLLSFYFLINSTFSSIWNYFWRARLQSEWTPFPQLPPLTRNQRLHRPLPPVPLIYMERKMADLEMQSGNESCAEEGWGHFWMTGGLWL